MGSPGTALARTAREVARCVRHPPVRRDLMAEWQRRIRGRPPPLPEGPLQRVLTVCHGNIARSAFAGALLSARAPHLSVRSGGLKAEEGRPADEAAVRTATGFDTNLASHRAHAVTAEDVEWADLILVMQGRHVVESGRRWPQASARVRLLGDYLDEPPFVIADPWGHGDDVFRLVFDRIERAVGLLVPSLEDASR